MVQATRSTAWVRSESGIERCVRWKAGYDCRVAFPHNPLGDHGQHGDELTLNVRTVGAALSLLLFTWARDGKDDQTGSKHPVEPVYLHSHFGFIWLEEQVRVAEEAAPCDVLELGKCWSPEGRTSFARELWELGTSSYIEREIASPRVEQIVLDGVPAVWIALEATLKKERELRWKEAEALPRQCDKCCGTGLVKRIV